MVRPVRRSCRTLKSFWRGRPMSCSSSRRGQPLSICLRTIKLCAIRHGCVPDRLLYLCCACSSWRRCGSDFASRSFENKFSMQKIFGGFNDCFERLCVRSKAAMGGRASCICDCFKNISFVPSDMTVLDHVPDGMLMGKDYAIVYLRNAGYVRL